MQRGIRSVQRGWRRYAVKPGKANNWLATFKARMGYAKQNGWRNDNPTIGVEMLDIGEHEPWPREVLEAALEIATPMTRLAILTGYYTGVRIGDAVRLQHIWITDGFIEFTTEKNKAHVALPVEPLWLVEIEKVPMDLCQDPL
jgi:integrase